MAVAISLCALPLWCQYPGQVAEPGKGAPELRSVAVLEWTGEAGHPKACRLVPVTVFDASRIEDNQLQDGGIYLARPEPLALAGEVEYEVQQDGKPAGLFDIRKTGREEGSWVGYGAWKQPAAPQPKPSMEEVARTKIDENDEESDRPVLHRKHHADEGSAGKGNGGQGKSAPENGGSGAGTSSTAPSSDSGGPTLHRKDTGSGTGDAGSGTSSSPAPAPDSNQPTLHRRDSTDTSGGSAPAGDSDRPVLKKSKKKKPEDLSHVESMPGFVDPDRPRLLRGKPRGNGLDVLPSLMGLPSDMEQAVAVSDQKTRPEHLWSFSWANPDDEAKMKAALEEIARDALGLKPPPPPPAPKRTASRKRAKPAPPPEPPPAPLFDERFRVFELAYGSGATMVLSARTDGPLAEQKFVTIIAQPDLYGNVLVLLKSVTDGAHLDETPRMRLIDAVDALADNRGELLFELRGATERQFALYRILRGQAQQLFVTGGGEFGTESAQ